MLWGSSLFPDSAWAERGDIQILESPGDRTPTVCITQLSFKRETFLHLLIHHMPGLLVTHAPQKAAVIIHPNAEGHFVPLRVLKHRQNFFFLSVKKQIYVLHILGK